MTARQDGEADTAEPRAGGRPERTEADAGKRWRRARGGDRRHTALADGARDADTNTAEPRARGRPERTGAGAGERRRRARGGDCQHAALAECARG